MRGTPDGISQRVSMKACSDPVVDPIRCREPQIPLDKVRLVLH